MFFHFSQNFFATPIFDAKTGVGTQKYVVSLTIVRGIYIEIKGEAALVKKDTRCATCEMRNDGKELVT